MLKDKNGIEKKCENCKYYGTYLFAPCMICGIKHTRGFKPTKEVLETRIMELQTELKVVQESEKAEVQEADRLRMEVKKLRHLDIAKLVKPLKWEEFPSSLSVKINGVRLFLREESGGFDFDVMGVYSERISLCDNIEYAKQYAQNWLVNLVKSACGLESGVQK